MIYDMIWPPTIQALIQIGQAIELFVADIPIGGQGI